MDALPTAPYLEQVALWPKSGRHILAHFDDSSIVVYQAYRQSIGRYAIEHGVLGGPEFSFSRMTWVKPNFLWMMYRSSWGVAEGQETVLGIRIRRVFFDQLLALAVPSSDSAGRYESRAKWQAALGSSSVRLQWDPDHDPRGEKLERRAIQLGLRGEVLRAYATTEILEVVDMTAFVAEQRSHTGRESWSKLRTPEERVYRPADESVGKDVGLER